MRMVAALLTTVFALALFVLPLIRVVQGRLPVRAAVGLWLAAAGFMVLALAAFGVLGSGAPAGILAGAGLAIVGNLVQRRMAT